MLNSIEATECANIPMPLTTRITREIRMAENENITKRKRARKVPDLTIHLYRGSPATRSWSKHQQTDTAWSLCGIYWKKNAERRGTEDASETNCQFCKQLLSL